MLQAWREQQLFCEQETQGPRWTRSGRSTRLDAGRKVSPLTV